MAGWPIQRSSGQRASVGRGRQPQCGGAFAVGPIRSAQRTSSSFLPGRPKRYGSAYRCRPPRCWRLRAPRRLDEFWRPSPTLARRQINASDKAVRGRGHTRVWGDFLQRVPYRRVLRAEKLVRDLDECEHSKTGHSLAGGFQCNGVRCARSYLRNGYCNALLCFQMILFMAQLARANC